MSSKPSILAVQKLIRHSSLARSHIDKSTCGYSPVFLSIHCAGFAGGQWFCTSNLRSRCNPLFIHIPKSGISNSMIGYNPLTPDKLSKDQLLSVLPILVQHLSSPNYVAYTYASIGIERILFMKQPGTTRTV